MTYLNKLALYSVLIGASVAAYAPNSCLAGNGTDTGNGGDICEDRIKIVRDDIASWIKKGGHSALALSDGMNADRYSTLMLGAISQTKVSCTDEVIFVGQAEKTCKNFSNEGTARIVCNAKRFLSTDESSQYVLVHHEYAGITGVEINNGEESNYSISDQISGFLVDLVVKKLAVSPGSSTITYDFFLSDLLKNAEVVISRGIDFAPEQTEVRHHSGAKSFAVEFDKDATYQRTIKPRKCLINKIDIPFFNNAVDHRLFLKGDEVCNSIVLRFFAHGPALFSETAAYANALFGIHILPPKPIHE